MTSDSIRKLLEIESERLKINTESMEDSVLFLIDTNYIAIIDKGIKNQECREKLIQFFNRKEKWKEIKQLLTSTYPNSKISKQLTNKNAYEKIKEDPAFRSNLSNYHFNVEQGVYLYLCDSIELERKKYIDRDFFHYFLAYRLSNCALERFMDCLVFTVSYYYEGKTDDFILDLSNIILPKHRHLFSSEKLRIFYSLLGIERENEISKPLGETPSTIKFTVKQISLSYYFKIEAKTFSDFPINEKTKAVNKIADKFNVSKKNLNTNVTNVLKAGKEGSDYRNSILKDKSNQEAIANLLSDDEKAILELKRAIDKLCSPLT